MLRRFVSLSALSVLVYLSAILVVQAQNNPMEVTINRLDDRTRQIESAQATNTAETNELQRQLHELQQQRLDERIAVVESTEATNTKLLIGICLGMFPVLIDLARRWMTQSQAKEPDPGD